MNNILNGEAKLVTNCLYHLKSYDVIGFSESHGCFIEDEINFVLWYMCERFHSLCNTIRQSFLWCFLKKQTKNKNLWALKHKCCAMAASEAFLFWQRKLDNRWLHQQPCDLAVEFTPTKKKWRKNILLLGCITKTEHLKFLFPGRLLRRVHGRRETTTVYLWGSCTG